LFDAAGAALGLIDILVNNAGAYGPMGGLDSMIWDEWSEAIDVNLLGTIYCTRRAVLLFKPNRYGKIINISGGGATAPLPGLSAYTASKAALVRFTETLALELRDWRIDVNAVARGALATRPTDPLIAAGADRVGTGLHTRMVKLKAEGGMPLELGAELCVYLASAEPAGSSLRNGIPGRSQSSKNENFWNPTSTLCVGSFRRSAGSLGDDR
jgi:3-oxoacyl-[acyl-carrier protein] reductase